MLSIAITTGQAAEFSVSSPDGDATFTFSDTNQLAHYTVTYKGETLIRPSKLGFTSEKAKPMYRHFSVEKVSANSHDSTWQQPWGEQRVIRNHYNELAVRFTLNEDKARSFVVRTRIFDDGIGFRYEMPDNGDIAVTRE